MTTPRAIRSTLWCAVIATTACDRPPSTDVPAAPEPAPALQRADIVRYHMRLHFDDLRSIEHYLVDGKLSEGTSLAFMLTNPEKDAGLLPWARQTRELVDTATKLSNAKSLDEALRLEVRVAVACAKCHDDAKPTAVFPMPGRPPLSDYTSQTVRMDRHRWATDRMWEGLVANSEDHWRAGLAVLAETPLPFSVTTDAPALATALQKRAMRTLLEPAPATAEERGRMYGEMLVTCAACHASVKHE